MNSGLGAAQPNMVAQQSAITDLVAVALDICSHFLTGAADSSLDALGHDWRLGALMRHKFPMLNDSLDDFNAIRFTGDTLYILGNPSKA
jgi:hypothetical protein